MASQNWQLYKYTINQCSVKVGDKTTKIEPGMIQNLYLEKDFDNDHFPVFMINIMMGSELYHKITEAQDSAILYLDIRSQVDAGNGVFENTRAYINDEFVMYALDNTPFLDEKTLENMKNTGSYGEGTVHLSDMQNSYPFILSRRADLTASKTIENNVMVSTNILTAISYIMSKCGCSNVLMAAPDNTTIYNELLLLPIPLVNQLIYLNSYYGIYKEGAQIFFDFDRIYCVPKSARCVAFDETEPKQILIHVYDNSTGAQMIRGSYIDDINRKGYITTGMDQFEVQDLSSTSSQYAGNNSLIINNTGNTDLATTSPTAGGGESFNIITTSTHNTLYPTEMQARLDELKSVIVITTSNCDLSLLTPNRVYNVISSSSKASEAIKYKYRLSSLKAMFIRDGAHFTNVTEMELRKSDVS